MQNIQEHLLEMYRTAAAFVAFLRAMVAARMTPLLGDERGEIASWVVVTKLTTTAHNIQTP